MIRLFKKKKIRTNCFILVKWKNILAETNVGLTICVLLISKITKKISFPSLKDSYGSCDIPFKILKRIDYVLTIQDSNTKHS